MLWALVRGSWRVSPPVFPVCRMCRVTLCPGRLCSSLSCWLVVSGPPRLWDPAPAKSQISECFCFSLQCVPLGPFGDLGLGEPVSQPLSKALVPVPEATSAGNDPRGQTSMVPGPVPPPKLSDSGQVTLP